MITEMFQCKENFQNFTNSCIPTNTNGSFDLDRVTPNIANGYCSNSLYNIFDNCLSKYFFYFISPTNSPCYASKEAFLSCLPGRVSNLTGWPKTCTLLSWAVFLSNEAISYLEGKAQILAFATTQGLRRVETLNCLPSCKEYDFKYLGPKEFPEEIYRYETAAMDLFIAPYLVNSISTRTTRSSRIGNVVGNVTYLFGRFTNRLTQLIHSVPQQGKRNADIIGTYKNCTFSELSLNVNTPPALPPNIKPSSVFKSSFPSFSILSVTKKTAAVAFDILSFILSNTYSISVNLLGPPLNALYESAPYGAKLCARAVFSLGEALFNGAAYATNYCLNNSFFSERIKNPPIKTGYKPKSWTLPYEELYEEELDDFMKLYGSDDKSGKTPRVDVVTDAKFNQKMVRNATNTANYLMGLFTCLGAGSC